MNVLAVSMAKKGYALSLWYIHPRRYTRLLLACVLTLGYASIFSCWQDTGNTQLTSWFVQMFMIGLSSCNHCFDCKHGLIWPLWYYNIYVQKITYSTVSTSAKTSQTVRVRIPININTQWHQGICIHWIFIAVWSNIYCCEQL